MTRNELIEELNYYKKIANQVEKEKIDAPEGSLRVSVDGNKYRYYLYHGERGNQVERSNLENVDTQVERNNQVNQKSAVAFSNHIQKEEYIHSGDIEIARKLAQKKYNDSVLKTAQKRISQIKRLLNDYEENEIDKLYDNAHPARKRLITPVEFTYEQKLSNWIQTSHEGKGFVDGTVDIRTNSGIRVRSKSEKILADYFESVGLNYKYECPLVLKPFGTIYPDFTFLSKKTGNEVYWEHEGMMDNPEYARSAIQKIDLYEKNGIYPGERLILTFETSVTTLNSKNIKDLTNKYLIG